MLFAILTLLFFVSWINERCQRSNERNSMWELFLSLLPINGCLFKNQFGVTRKLLMATSGFGILILSSLYQAKLSQELMIPNAPPDVTLSDIQHLVVSGQVKLLMPYANATIMQYISTVAPAMGSVQPIYDSDYNTILNTINKHNAVYFGPENTLLFFLSETTSKECANYLYVSFDDLSRSMSGIIITKRRVDILESMNAIVAERMSYVDDHIRSYQMTDECRKYIFPVHTPDPKFERLHLMEFTGTFMLWLLFLFGSLLVFIGEKFYDCIFFYCKQPEVEEEPLHISLNVIGKRLSLKTQKIISIYFINILEEIENDT
jgi:hypothetical protein